MMLAQTFAQTSEVVWSQAEIIQTEASHTSGVYPKRQVAIVRGQGAHVWDAEGREYIDCVAGQGSANLGHCHPAVVAAITEQAGQLITCPETFHNDVRVALLHRLAQVAPPGLDRTFLCNSGTEAVEAAIKFARASTGRPGIIAANRGFHGRTMGALSATWKEEYRRPFAPLTPGFSHVPFNDLSALEAAVTAETAAVLLEPVQGEGGVHVARREYLQTAAELCRQRGALLVLDEVQTGFGRTGRLFACEHFDVVPDLLCVAKSMAGGLPMGACMIGPRVGTLAPMSHGSTFGGNPLACAAALAALDALTSEYPAPGSGETLPGRAARLGEHLMDEIRGAPCAARARGARVGADGRRGVEGKGDPCVAATAGPGGAGAAGRDDGLAVAASAGDRGRRPGEGCRRTGGGAGARTKNGRRKKKNGRSCFFLFPSSF